MADGRHTLHLDDEAVACIERALQSHAGVLRLTGGFRPTDQTHHESDLTARAAALVQHHLKGCGCPPVKGANPQ
jgi:hypothetical protein